MKIIIWIVVGVVAAGLILFSIGWFNAFRASKVRKRKLDEMIQPVLDAVLANHPSASDLVKKFAENPATRNQLFARLKENDKEDIFPIDWRRIEKVAESDLARWLMHGNELGIAPLGIELVQGIQVSEQEKSGNIFLFRFRTGPPHWASKYGWMAGIAGPYWDGADAPDSGPKAFSELTPFDKMTIEEHVDYLRKALKKKGLVKSR